jgi:hypothetical protein
LKNRSGTIQFRWSNDFACARNRRGRICARQEPNRHLGSSNK